MKIILKRKLDLRGLKAASFWKLLDCDLFGSQLTLTKPDTCDSTFSEQGLFGVVRRASITVKFEVVS
jgi:hypothetical protein